MNVLGNELISRFGLLFPAVIKSPGRNVLDDFLGTGPAPVIEESFTLFGSHVGFRGILLYVATIPASVGAFSS